MSSRRVTSAANPAIKSARALHTRKAREESGEFLVEGLRSITEALELGRRPRLILFSAAAADHPLLRQALAAAHEALEVTPDLLTRISRRDNPQSVLGVFEQQFASLDAPDTAAAGCWVALEAVRDPGNLGTIIRTADAAGCGGVVLLGDCCDPHSTEAVRATMGSIFAVRLVRASLEAFLAWRRTWRGQLVGAAVQGTVSYRQHPFESPCMIAMGTEQSGLSAAMLEACDAVVSIPMRGRADSLNLAVATGLMLFAATEAQHG